MRKHPGIALVCLLSCVAALGCVSRSPAAGSPGTVWPVHDAAKIAGHATEILGAPRARGGGADAALVFDGKADGVFVPINPLAGWSAFTIEVRFKPDGTGSEEQRFLHLEDEQKRRVLIETRLTPDRQWSLDTFLFQDATHKLTLLDRTRRHPTDRWYWVALVYDGRKMSHYVDGVLELEGEVPFPPMSAGRTSIGVRQNRVSWFKGAISEVRFTPSALPAAQLRR
jgi:hypothetical protein